MVLTTCNGTINEVFILPREPGLGQSSVVLKDPDNSSEFEGSHHLATTTDGFSNDNDQCNDADGHRHTTIEHHLYGANVTRNKTDHLHRQDTMSLSEPPPCRSLYETTYGAGFKNPKKLTTEIKTTIELVDFRHPNDDRLHQLIVNNTSYFIRPEMAKKLSPAFDKFVLKKDRHGNIHFEIDDVFEDGINLLLNAICPEDGFGIYPSVLNESTFCQLTEFAHRFRSGQLIKHCEAFVATFPFDDLALSPVLVQMLDAAWRYTMPDAIIIRLLEGVIGWGVAKSCDPAIDSEVAELIMEAHYIYKTGELKHGDQLQKSVRPGLPCRTCRTGWSSTHVICSCCKNVVCNQCHLYKPCMAQLKVLLTEFRLYFNEKF